ncbi:MAG: hypothetical protein AAFR88_04940 [Pseudomonadota bacterium]
MTKVQCIVTRKMKLNGELYAKGAKIELNAQQYNDLKPTGMVISEADLKAQADAETAEKAKATTATKGKSAS